METLECLPFDALSVLLTWKTIELVGDVVAQELRNQLVNCGVIVRVYNRIELFE
jgi:hypothetical protein